MCFESVNCLYWLNRNEECVLSILTCGSLRLVFGKWILLGKTTEFLMAAAASFEPYIWFDRYENRSSVGTLELEAAYFIVTLMHVTCVCEWRWTVKILCISKMEIIDLLIYFTNKIESHLNKHNTRRPNLFRVDRSICDRINTGISNNLVLFSTFEAIIQTNKHRTH